MVRTSDGIVSSSDVKAYIRQHENKSLLRFIACGSVDDGKSTLIGRLLYESQMVFADHLDAVAADSIRYGTQGNEVDLALLVDGLSAEREQGITIDVAYRFFHTREEARAHARHIEEAHGRVLLRPTNLEDVFIELTGRKEGL